jgi:AcrR family transcriptional regulator
MPTSGVYGGLSADERASQRRSRLLAAGLEVIGTKGFPNTTVRGICGEARLTSRFFYESFADLDALAVAVFDDVVERASAALLEAVAAADPQDPRAQAEAGIATLIGQLTDDPRRARVAFVEALGSEPLAKRRLQAMRALASLIAAHGRKTYDPPPEADHLVDVTATMLAGGIAELMLTWLDGSLRTTRAQLVEDCTALFMATVEGAAAVGAERARR